MKNRKTTVAGIASILSGIAKILNEGTVSIDAVGLIVAGIGLVFSKDFNVTGTK